jgi:hypothetical protein
MTQRNLIGETFRKQSLKPTPTPWKASRVARKSNYGDFTVHITGAIDDPIRKGEKYHETVCKVSGGVHDKPEVAEANAAFIVHAVNCHGQLVSALETARLQLGEYTDGEGAAKLHTLAIIDRALIEAKKAPYSP